MPDVLRRRGVERTHDDRRDVATVGSPLDPPATIPISEFKAPFTYGLSGKSYSAYEVVAQVKNLAKGLAQEPG